MGKHAECPSVQGFLSEVILYLNPPPKQKHQKTKTEKETEVASHWSGEQKATASHWIKPPFSSEPKPVRLHGPQCCWYGPELELQVLPGVELSSSRTARSSEVRTLLRWGQLVGLVGGLGCRGQLGTVCSHKFNSWVVAGPSFWTPHFWVLLFRFK